MLQVNIEKIIPVTEARDMFNRIIDDVEGTNELYVLTKNGKPAAVVVGVNHLEKLTGDPHADVVAELDDTHETPDVFGSASEAKAEPESETVFASAEPQIPLPSAEPSALPSNDFSAAPAAPTPAPAVYDSNEIVPGPTDFYPSAPTPSPAANTAPTPMPAPDTIEDPFASSNAADDDLFANPATKTDNADITPTPPAQF